MCLKELSTLLLSLREVASSARDALLQGDRSVLLLVEHPSKSVRLAAGASLWALLLAIPSQLAGLLNGSINRVRSELAKVASNPNDSKGQERLLAHAHAVGAIVCAIPHTPHGAPHALITAVIGAAAELASVQGVEAAQHAAWLLMRAMMRTDPEWLGSKTRLTQLLGLWKGVLAGKVEVGASPHPSHPLPRPPLLNPSLGIPPTPPPTPLRWALAAAPRPSSASCAAARTRLAASSLS